MNVTFIRPKKRIKKATTDCHLKEADRVRVHRRVHIPCVCVCGYQHGETQEWRRSSKFAAAVTSLGFAPSACIGRSIGLLYSVCRRVGASRNAAAWNREAWIWREWPARKVGCMAFCSVCGVRESLCCVEWGMFSVIVVMCLIGGVLLAVLIKGFLATCDKH